MQSNEMKAALVSHFNSQGIVMPADIDREISELAKTYPVASAKEEGIESDVVACAYKAFMIMNKQNNAGTSVVPVSVAAPTTVSAADKQKVGKVIQAQQKDRIKTTNATTINTLIIDKPAPVEYIPAGTTIVFTGDAKAAMLTKLAKDEAKVVADTDDFKSRSNYDALVLAVTNETPIEVSISDKNPMKPIGVNMDTLDSTGAGAVSRVQSIEKLREFLTMDAAGYVAPRAGKPGCRLKKVSASASAGTTGKVKKDRTVVAFVDKKEAIQSGAYVIASRKDETGAKAKRTVRSLLTYKITTDNIVAKTGQPKLSTKAVTQSQELPALQYETAYAELQPKSKAADPFSDIDVLKNIAEAQQLEIINIQKLCDETNGTGVSASTKTKLESFEKATSGSAGNVVL